MPMVIGRMIASRLRARSRFSNCPPQSTRVAGREFDGALRICACASLTKLPWSRPRMLVRTEIWRLFSRRAMMLAPLTTSMSRQLRERHAAAFARRHQDVADGRRRRRAPAPGSAR